MAKNGSKRQRQQRRKNNIISCATAAWRVARNQHQQQRRLLGGDISIASAARDVSLLQQRISSGIGEASHRNAA